VSDEIQLKLPEHPVRRVHGPRLRPRPTAEVRPCPICGAPTEAEEIGDKSGWVCIEGGYAHYYQARYAHLQAWFTSGEGNLREPLIGAMNNAA